MPAQSAGQLHLQTTLCSNAGPQRETEPGEWFMYICWLCFRGRFSDADSCFKWSVVAAGVCVWRCCRDCAGTACACRDCVGTACSEMSAGSDRVGPRMSQIFPPLTWRNTAQSVMWRRKTSQKCQNRDQKFGLSFDTGGIKSRIITAIRSAVLRTFPFLRAFR